jgi:AraC-like DNA-binding protein
MSNRPRDGSMTDAEIATARGAGAISGTTMDASASNKNMRTSKNRKRGESKISPRRIDSQERVAKALELRKAGETLQQIADQLGYANPSAVYAAIRRTLDQIVVPAVEEYRKMELERLDALQLAVWPAARRGDYQAIDRVLKIMERRARLLGLDVQPDATVSIEPTQVIVQMVHEVVGERDIDEANVIEASAREA